jgi:phenylalanyl-tRNA synthetase alpha chain
VPDAADLRAIVAEAERAFAAVRSLQELIEARARFLGKKGSVSSLLRGLGGLAPAERAALGAEANAAKQRIEALAGARRAELERAEEAHALSAGRLDVSLPGAAPPRGRLHPVSVIEREVSAFFTTLGYSIEDGPEVETEWNNFGALNFPEDHPARDLQDTFFVEGGHVLRTHTSPVQIRTMTGRTPPFRFVVPGRVYRHDFDATHSPMFHQIEGFCVGESVSFADLKGTLYAFAKHLFGPDAKLRFRAHFFPFTEPSAEMDVTWRGGWLEWGGCGMIHPRVLLNCGVDPERWQGFAFGMALDRPAMLRFGIPNIQWLFDGDLRLLEQL